MCVEVYLLCKGLNLVLYALMSSCVCVKTGVLEEFTFIAPLRLSV